jgi:uncharacterized protein (DUF39 family)
MAKTIAEINEKIKQGTLAVIGDLKQMNSKWLVGLSIIGYGVSLIVGIGVPIPVLNERIARYTAVKEQDIFAPVVDYSKEYPYFEKPERELGRVSYKELKSGKVKILGKEVPTTTFSNYRKAREIAEILKDWIRSDKFLLTEPVEKLPSADSGLISKLLKERPIH